jgi:hypothetical protein
VHVADAAAAAIADESLTLVYNPTRPARAIENSLESTASRDHDDCAASVPTGGGSSSSSATRSPSPCEPDQLDERFGDRVIVWVVRVE